MVACDFFTVETAWMRTLYVLFFVELGSRRVHLAGVTANPDSEWMRQQAHNLAIEERLGNVRFLLHDRDAKFSGSFDELIRSEGVRVLKTPVRAPQANAVAERWVRTVRNECGPTQARTAHILGVVDRTQQSGRHWSESEFRPLHPLLSRRCRRS